MSKKKVLIIVSAVLGIFVLAIGGFFVYNTYLAGKSPAPTSSQEKTEALKLDPQKEATHLSKVAGTPGAYWMRGLPFIWNDIEREKGKFDWTITDSNLNKSKTPKGESEERYHLAMIWPYANWDQDTCHKDSKYLATGHLKESSEDLKMGAPCAMQAYASFLEKLVERYDGDGKDDMPGLKIPIKYWEIMNEPEMQGGSTGGAGEDLKFFVGTPKEYLEILKTSYETIKKADPQAKVAHAGMAGMQQNFQDFWDPIFKAGGGNYFDIANIHTISTDTRREDLYVIKFKKYLEKYGIANKPIWVTEVQFGSLQDEPKDLPAFEKLLARSSVFALAKGTDKLFYIENWLFWGNMPGPGEKDKKEDGKMTQEMEKALQGSTHKVYLNLVNKINSFEKVEVLAEKFVEGPGDPDGATSQIGQYKFINGSKVVYVLWGQATLPSEISGKVKVTDIYGEGEEVDAGSIILSDEPIFLELL